MPSCDTNSLRGIQQIVESTQCQVIVPRDRIDQVRMACPTAVVLTAENDLNHVDGISARVIPIQGLGQAQVAYVIEWIGKSVIISGDVPVGMAVPMNRLTSSEITASDFLLSLNQLERLQPDVWLPSVPINGQNANIYGNEWRDTISTNRQIVRRRVR